MKRSTQRENSSSGGGGNSQASTASTTRSNHRTGGGTSVGQIILVVVVLIIIVGLTLTQQSIERNSLVEMMSFETTTSASSSDDSSSSSSTTNVRQRPQQLQQQRRQPNHRYSKSSQKYTPISCHELFGLDAHEKRHGATQVSDPNEGIIHARRTITPPYFWISLHQHDYDRTRWAVMEYGFYYERQQSRAFIQILKSSGLGKRITSSSSSSNAPLPPLHVVDVGGNIGWYSMLSVATALSSNRSVVVDVFEPNPRNRYRMCESLQMNQWIDHELVDFHIYTLGVSSSSGGTVRMSIADSGIGKLGRVSLLNETENINLSLVSLDDMSTELGWEDDKSSPIHILKVDVEGLELEVFQGAQRLLQSGRVENIFFEGNSRDDEEAAKFQTLIKLLVQSGYHAYKHGSWMGPHKLIVTHPVPKRKAKQQEELVVTYTEALIAECGTNHVVSPALAAAGHKAENQQCNLWWRKTPNTEAVATAATTR